MDEILVPITLVTATLCSWCIQDMVDKSIKTVFATIGAGVVFMGTGYLCAYITDECNKPAYNSKK